MPVVHYAATTKVPVSKTRSQIEDIVKKYGASKFGAGWDGDRARVEFMCRGRHIRCTMPVNDTMPLQTQRSRWRALLLLVKAKLAAVDAKIATFEEVFAGDTVMPDGRTVWESVREPIALAYSSGAAPKLLGSS